MSETERCVFVRPSARRLVSFADIDRWSRMRDPSPPKGRLSDTFPRGEPPMTAERRRAERFACRWAQRSRSTEAPANRGPDT